LWAFVPDFRFALMRNQRASKQQIGQAKAFALFEVSDAMVEASAAVDFLNSFHDDNSTTSVVESINAL
jgi:hypothetical protein